MNPQIADRLHDVLTRQYAAHRELLAALGEQTQAVRAFNHEALDASRSRCDLLTQRLAELDEARLRITGEMTLSDIIAGLDEPYRGRLLAIRASLRELAQQVVAVSRVNSMAIGAMMQHVHSVYQMMASAGKAGSYDAAGASKAARGGAFMIDAVA